MCMECLERQAVEATREISAKLMEARDQLTAVLTPEQMTAFNVFDDLTVLEMQLIQDGMARMVCGG